MLLRLGPCNPLILTAPGWIERLGLGSAPSDRTPCTLKMHLLEQSICKYAEEPGKSVSKPKLRLTFNSFEEAYDLYSLTQTVP